MADVDNISDGVSLQLWIENTELHWKKSSHSKMIVSSVEYMLNNEELSDVTIVIEEHKFQCHRIILAAASKYFHKMFTCGLKETSMNEVTLHDITKATFKDVLQYMYNGKININNSNIQGLLHASDMLLLDSLKEGCVEFYQRFLSVENCIDIWRYSEQCNALLLKEEALQYASKHFSRIIETKEFLQLDYKDLALYLEHPDLNVKKLEDICKTFGQWLEFSPERRSKHVMYILPKLRLLNQKTRCIKQILMDNEIIKKNAEAVRFLQDVLNHMLYLEPLPDNFELQPLRQHCTYPYICVVLGGFAHGKKSRLCHISSFDDRNRVMSSATVCEVPSVCNIEMSSCVADDIIYISGVGENTKEIWKFDLNRTVWARCSSMKEGRICHAMVAGPWVDQCIYIVGGYNEGEDRIIADVEIHDITRNTTNKICSIIKPVACCTAQYYKGFIYTFGGVTEEDRPSSWIQAINTDTKQCSLLPLKLQVPSLRLRSFVCINKLVAIGSHSSFIIDMPKLHQLDKETPDVDKIVESSKSESKECVNFENSSKTVAASSSCEADGLTTKDNASCKSEIEGHTTKDNDIIQTRKGVNKDLFGLELLGDKLIILGGRHQEQDSNLTDNIEMIPIPDIIHSDETKWEFIGKLSFPTAIYATGVVSVKEYLVQDINFTSL